MNSIKVKINGKEIISGNINFAQNKAHNNKQYAVYAVTLKDFFNSHSCLFMEK